MKNGQGAAFITALLGGLILGVPAHAQFSTMDVGYTAASGTRIGNGSFALYPIAPFTVTTSGFSQTLVGTLISADYSTVTRNHRQAVSFGGWAWFRDNADILELHGKYYLTPRWGAQVGVLGSTHGGGNPVDFFLVHQLPLTRGSARQPINLQIAVGGFIDPAGGVTTAGFSTYLQAEWKLRANLSLDLSYWYLQDKGINGHRFALGAGYRF